MYDTLLYINEMQLQESNPLLISKIYASVEAMEADSAPVSDLTGRPLRAGQVVCIVTGDPDDADEGVIYRYNGTTQGTSSWTAVGRIGSDPYLEGYLYMGVATPATDPETVNITQRVFYRAVEPGTYTNFGGIVVNSGEVVNLKFDGSSWSKEVTGEASAASVTQLGQKTNYGIPYNSMPKMLGWPGETGWGDFPPPASRTAYHRVVPISGGETISIAMPVSAVVYAWLVKSYTPPSSSEDVFDLATGETAGHRISTALVTLVAPVDARFIIIGCEIGGADRIPVSFKINDYNVLSGTRYPIVSSIDSYAVTLNGAGATRETTTSFILRKGKKYKIHFESQRFHVYGTTYLYLRFGDNYLSGVKSNGESYTLLFTAESAGVISVPEDCIFTPAHDGSIFIYTRFYEETCLKITFTEIDVNLNTLVSDNSQLLQRRIDFRSIEVENMLTGGRYIGDPDATQTYMQSCVEVDGEFYVAAFCSKTMKSEADPNDSAGGLIYFNAANPEKTTVFIPALSPGDVIFEGVASTCDHVSYCMNGLVDDKVRTICRTSLYMVYKDYDPFTKQFEQYAHQCKIAIEGTDYDLTLTNSQAIQEALGLTKYADGTNILSFSGNPIEVNGYWYGCLNFYGFSHALCRTQDFETWEFVSEFPYPYLSDEFQLAYAYGRIYATCTGNIDRRPNGYFSAIMYYTISNNTWSAIKYLEPYGHDMCTMVFVEGCLVVMQQKLKRRYPDDDTSIYVRDTTFVNGKQLARSNKTIFVFDKDLNILNSVDIHLRRAAVTCLFIVHGGNLYALAGTNPKALDGDGRQDAMFSYIDIRYLLM